MDELQLKEGGQRLQRMLADWLTATGEEPEIQYEAQSVDEPFDFVLEAQNRVFAVVLKRSGSLATINRAAVHLQDYGQPFTNAERFIPLLVVNHMTPKGREICRDAGISWADLSGNAHIEAPGLLIHVEGKPNQFKRKRPSNAFASKGSRIARYLLLHPDEWFLQRELTEATGLSEGYTSRIVRSLDEDRLVERKTEGRASKVRVRNPDLLLDTWQENYEFSTHTIEKGVVPARSATKLVERVADELEDEFAQSAATGLAAAWLFDQFANFRTTTFYLASPPTEEFKERIGFRSDPRGANLWLVIPDDIGVFEGSALIDGIRCVHPVQVYLDLKGHPERSDEAAEHLRANHLKWENDG